MTLSELESLDFATLWARLPSRHQAAIGVAAITKEFASLVAQDDGTDASPAERGVADGIENKILNELPGLVGGAFPQFQWEDENALTHAWQIMPDAMVEPGKIRVKGLRGLRRAYSCRLLGWSIRLGGRDVEIGGFENAETDPGLPPIWIGWTVDQIEAERLRRHPVDPPRTPQPVRHSRHLQELCHAQAA